MKALKGYRTVVVSVLKFVLAVVLIAMQYLDMLGLDAATFAISMIVFKIAELGIETFLRWITTTPVGEKH